MFRKHPKTVAILLLLVFTQKAGLRLWMHQWFHENNTAQSQSSPRSDNPGSDNLQLKCDCFDDAMMPLLESPAFTAPAPVRQFSTLIVVRHSSLLSADQVYYSLKGPPATSARA
jgi:hypothetical protein